MYQNIDIVVSTTLPTIDRLNTYKNGWDALFLYFRYVRQARLQKTNTTYSKDTFMAEGMSWSMTKFYKVKKILTENKLIETIIRKWENWQIEGSYVQVNFLIQDNHSTTLPLSGENHWVVKKVANAWSNKTINAWSNKTINTIYKSYADRIPSDKKKYNMSAKAKLYIWQLLKEYTEEQLLQASNNYMRKTSSMYIIASQYFFSNTKSPNAKHYRVFEDFLWEDEAEQKSVNFDNLF